VNYSVGGTATPGVDYAILPGTITLAAGATATNILVTPFGDNLSANQVSVTLNLIPSASYLLTTLTNATVNILDRPLNTWLRSNFTAAELANPRISGDAADPDQDRIPNLVEYALGLSPKTPKPEPVHAIFQQRRLWYYIHAIRQRHRRLACAGMVHEPPQLVLGHQLLSNHYPIRQRLIPRRPLSPSAIHARRHLPL
jgi:hypothetical protein